MVDARRRVHNHSKQVTRSGRERSVQPQHTTGNDVNDLTPIERMRIGQAVRPVFTSGVTPTIDRIGSCLIDLVGQVLRSYQKLTNGIRLFFADKTVDVNIDGFASLARGEC